MKFSALFLAAALLGAAPAAAVRHLTYAYAVYPTTGSDRPVTDFQGPSTGTMDVAILGAAADGGTLVEARDWWWNAIRPRQTAQCEVYADGRMSCNEYPLLSDAQEVLLPLLARQFYPGAAQTHWQRQYTYHWGQQLALIETGQVNYTVQTASADRVDIAATGLYTVPGFRARTIHETATMSYDPVAALPTLVHDTKSGTTQNAFYSHTVDLKLLTNSGVSSSP